MKKLFPLLVAAALTAAGCVVYADGPAAVNGHGTAGAPVVQGISYNPPNPTKDDTITFTVVSSDPTGQPLQYTWSATKGTLSATSGQLVTWRPLKSDGTPDAGLATVMVLVSNGRQSVSSSINIQIAADGAVAMGQTGASPAPTASPTASPSPEPSATPTAMPSEEPAATPAEDPEATAAEDPDASPAEDPTASN